MAQQQVRFKIEGIEAEFVVGQIPPMRAYRLQPRIGKALAPAFGLLAQAAAQGLDDVDVARAGGAVASLCENLPPDELEAITRELLSTTQVVIDGKVAPVMEKFDLLFGGKMLAVFKLVAKAFEVNYGDFFAAFRAAVPAREGASDPSPG